MNAWLFLDEFRQLAPLEFIGNVVRRGRKSGVNVFATLQSIAGLRDRYSADRATEMLGLFNCVVALRCGNEVDAADWLSRLLGEPEYPQGHPPPPRGPVARREGPVLPQRGPPAERHGRSDPPMR